MKCTVGGTSIRTLPVKWISQYLSHPPPKMSEIWSPDLFLQSFSSLYKSARIVWLMPVKLLSTATALVQVISNRSHDFACPHIMAKYALETIFQAFRKGWENYVMLLPLYEFFKTSCTWNISKQGSIWYIHVNISACGRIWISATELVVKGNMTSFVEAHRSWLLMWSVPLLSLGSLLSFVSHTHIQYTRAAAAFVLS